MRSGCETCLSDAVVRDAEERSLREERLMLSCRSPVVQSRVMCMDHVPAYMSMNAGDMVFETTPHVSVEGEESMNRSLRRDDMAISCRVSRVA